MAEARREDAPELREAVGLFHDTASLEAAIAALESAGIDRAEISILARGEGDGDAAPHQAAEDPAAPRQPPVSDTDMQQSRTLTTSMAAVIAAFAASGITVMTGGAAAAAIAAALASGGGIAVIGAAVGLAAEEQRGDFLHRQIDRGGILVWVKIRDPAQGAAIRDILARHGASAVHEHDIDVYPPR